MSNRKERVAHIKTHASRRLRLNLRILAIVYIVLFIVSLYSIIASQAIFWQVLLAIILGLGAGLLSARMYKITWDKHEAEVVGRIDLYGIAVLILFALFEFNRNTIVGTFVHGPSLGSIALVMVTSALFGRLLGTSRRIIHILVREKII